MAFSATQRGPNITLGNVKAKVFDVNFASVTEGELSTGFGNVIAAFYVPETSDDHGIVNLNSSTASVVEDDFGSVFISAVTSNDTGHVIVIGV